MIILRQAVMVLLALALAACGKGDKAKAETTPDTTTNTAVDAAPVANAEGPLQIMTKFTDELCACKDMACAEAVQRRMGEWGETLKDDQTKPTEVEMKAAMNLLQRMEECMQRLAPEEPAAPAPEPAQPVAL